MAHWGFTPQRIMKVALEPSRRLGLEQRERPHGPGFVALFLPALAVILFLLVPLAALLWRAFPVFVFQSVQPVWWPTLCRSVCGPLW